MYEQSKAAKRRFNIGAFTTRYFIGNGIDVGCGADSIGQYLSIFPGITSITPFDQEQGDAQYLREIKDDTYNFLHASHCLEHMRNIEVALDNWIRVVKEEGYLIITVPDEDMYENGFFPSLYNPDHKFTFTIHKRKSWCTKSINVLDLLRKVSDKVEIEKIELQKDFYRKELENIDQTMTPVAECCIEIILKKRKREK